MINLNTIKSLYFIGAGGIGMSALIRYFLAKGKFVAGYDKTATDLTLKLNEEGALIHYEDNVKLIPDCCLDKETTLVVYTPAVPQTHSELTYFRENGFEILKRAQLLGLITNISKGLCMAGTHGKTTTSSMLAHILKSSHVDCNAFLGGILKNYGSNLMLSDTSDLTVIEADEYDRSFHQLSPYMAAITSVDPDHLDIYGTEEAYKESFAIFTSLIRPDGVLLMRKGIDLQPRLQDGVKLYTYSGENEGDFYAENVKIGNGEIIFDFVTPNSKIKNIILGVPVKINIENAVVAMAIAWLNGVKEDELREAMASFAGAKRRFDFYLKHDDIVLIDDYAHHPSELEASIQSVKALYPNKKITGIFQPHLFSRTNDFASEFAHSLSLLDQLILLDIYPAREEPIPGVTSKLIFDQVSISDKQMVNKADLLSVIEKGNYQVLLMIGAGDIDRLLVPVKEILEKKRCAR